MNICFLTHEFPKPGLNPGGVGVFLKTFLPQLVKNGVQVTVLGANNLNKYEESIHFGVKIIRISNPGIRGINWFLIARSLNNKLKQLHSEKPLDIIEGSELSFAFLKKPNGVKFIIRLHGGHHFFAESENRGVHPWKGFQEKLSFKKADGFIAVSEFVKNHTNKYLNFFNKPIVKISGGIDVDFFSFSPVSLSSNPHSLVFVGTICEKKGVRNLILALKQVKIKFPNVRLDIYGKDWFFPNGKSYRLMIQEMIKGEMESHVYIHSPVPHEQIPEIYKSAEICIFPSFMETQGLVVSEAMAMGKIVIFTNKGPGPELIHHGVNGFLCDPLDISSIADTIEEVFNSSHKKNEISIAAREFVKRNLGFHKVLNQNIDFYNKVIHE